VNELVAITATHSYVHFTNPIVAISVDPPSHDVSCMGITALTTLNGITVILGTCEVVCERSAVRTVDLASLNVSVILVRCAWCWVVASHIFRIYSGTCSTTSASAKYEIAKL
jgi:hypothetical protein